MEHSNEPIFLNFFHEIENQLNTISASIDIIGRSCPETGKIDKPNLIHHSSIIQETVELMKLHVSLVNIETNPSFFKLQKEKTLDIYGAFVRTTYIFKHRARRRKIKFKIEAEKIPSIEVLPIMNIAPYIIFDNCLKYSPSDSIVYITFEVVHNSIKIDIESIGPKVEEDEMDKIIQKGYRGRNAIKANSSGSGIGLHYLKIICDLCNVNLNITSQNNSFNINNIEYSNFKISLLLSK